MIGPCCGSRTPPWLMQMSTTSGLSLDELFGMQLDARLQLPEHVPPVDLGHGERAS